MNPRVVVVSGGGTGIGRAIARRFAMVGGQVVIIGRREKVLNATAQDLNQEKGVQGTGVQAVPADLTDPKQIRTVVESIGHRTNGVVDVLVNCAGGVYRGPDAKLEELSNDWVENYRLNVLTAVLLTEGLASMLRRPGGSIINMSSIAALRGGGGSYSAAKAALIGWTYDLASRFGRDGIRANVIVPGYVTGTEFFGNTMTPERHQRLVAQTLLGRPGTPEDVAGVAWYLASEEAAFVTGQVVQVNGGALFGR